ncbi:MAG: amino acid dehydrogenase, partial [Xanthomonadaceae bacterium]|nr:amino acid dehydrogenase [Xanthomonadaceae bacterium]
MDVLLKKLKNEMSREIKQILDDRCLQGEKNFDWLQANLNPYFFITMAGEHDALANLVSGLHTVSHNRRLVVADQERQLIQASLSRPGSLHHSFMQLQEKEISYAEVCHSYRPIP